MTNLSRIRVVWSGTPVVGTGLTTFYVQGSASSLPASVKAFFTATKATFPSGITWTIPNTGDVIDDTNGTLVSVWTGSGGGTETSGGTGTNFVQGAGGRVKWLTGGIYRGRRVVGTTFMVPLVMDYWEGASAISSVALSNWSTAAANLLAAEPGLAVYSREVESDPDADPPVVGTPGESNLIVSALVPDATSWIRSRRV